MSDKNADGQAGHKQGCPALGGYGHGFEACICGFQEGHAAGPLNQCDGCARGLPIKNGNHIEAGLPVIACTADRYGFSSSPNNELIEELAKTAYNQLGGVTEADIRYAIREYIRRSAGKGAIHDPEGQHYAGEKL